MPITILLFLISEGILTAFLRFLAMYILIEEGLSNPFDQNFGLYWGILGLLAALYFIISTIKYYLLYTLILKTN